ncbi:MAG: stage II sporulation protein M [archaeon]
MKKVKKQSLHQQVKDNFEKSLIFIRESKNYIYFISVIFILGIIGGFIYSSQLSFLDEILKNIIQKTTDMNGLELILYIFNNNASVAFSSIVFGILLGLIPIFYSITNGVILGYVFSKIYNLSGFSEFWRILPHGIFELPAIIISMALGLKLGLFFYSSNTWKEFKQRVMGSFRTFIFVVIPLLVIAALIEGLLITYFR